MKTTYNDTNSHPRDSLLLFDELTHTYTHGRQALKPVTTLVSECFEAFDIDYWAPRSAARLGITEQQVRKMWNDKAERARTLGTEMHAKIENYYLGGQNTTDETYRLFEQFTRAYTLHPYRTEWPVFDEDLHIAGTIDFLEYHNGEYVIYDWKRSDKLISNGAPEIYNRYNKTGKHPLTHLPDTAYWHYALQLSIYRYILQRKYDINVARGRLGVFHPSNPTFYVLEMPYLQHEMRLLFG